MVTSCCNIIYHSNAKCTVLVTDYEFVLVEIQDQFLRFGRVTIKVTYPNHDEEQLQIYKLSQRYFLLIVPFAVQLSILIYLIITVTTTPTLVANNNQIALNTSAQTLSSTAI